MFSLPSDYHTQLRFVLKPPFRNLSRATFAMDWHIPLPILRPLSATETVAPTASAWEKSLAQCGLTWNYEPETLRSAQPLQRFYQRQGLAHCDPRAVALANLLGLLPASTFNAAQLAQIDLEHVKTLLAATLLPPCPPIVDWHRIAPTWTHDAIAAMVERQKNVRRRNPPHPWLTAGYRLIAEYFPKLKQTKTLAEAEALWRQFETEAQPPAALAVAYWWEAAWSLSEAGNIPDASHAAKLSVKRLGELAPSGRHPDSRWQHQQGRIAYYQGNFPRALEILTTNWLQLSRDPLAQAAVARDLANLLSDMGELTAAKTLAETSLRAAEDQGQSEELLKTHGRLAEIALKQGDWDTARHHLEAAMPLATTPQEKARIFTYSGHLAILTQEWDAAQTAYDNAAALQPENLYRLMGQFALAAWRGNTAQLAQAWEQHATYLTAQYDHPTHILPAAVCLLAAASAIDAAKTALPEAAAALIRHRFVWETLPFLVALPAEESSPLWPKLQATAQSWQLAIDQLDPEIREHLPITELERRLPTLMTNPNLLLVGTLRYMTFPSVLAPIPAKKAKR